MPHENGRIPISSSLWRIKETYVCDGKRRKSIEIKKSVDFVKLRNMRPLSVFHRALHTRLEGAVHTMENWTRYRKERRREMNYSLKADDRGGERLFPPFQKEGSVDAQAVKH
jgi:hypothetical protein